MIEKTVDLSFAHHTYEFEDALETLRHVGDVAQADSSMSRGDLMFRLGYIRGIALKFLERFDEDEDEEEARFATPVKTTESEVGA